MTSHVAWNDIRAEHVALAGGEAAVEAGTREQDLRSRTGTTAIAATSTSMRA